VTAVSKELRSVGIAAAEYHSAMSGDRLGTLAGLAELGGVVIAIRCLDEGVDIPEVDHALILASSANSREFIQRRGRVLRTARDLGKTSAEIHDVLVTSPGGTSNGKVLSGELERARLFATDARNSAVRATLRRVASLSDLSTDEVEMPEVTATASEVAIQ
jgi:superfamily II DNA or RNA helicase